MAATGSGSAGGSSSSNGGERPMVTLVTSDNARFEVAEAAASLSRTVRRMLDDAGGSCGDGIPLPNLDARTLAKVIEYCNRHATAAAASASASTAAAAANAPDAAAPVVGEDLDLEMFDKEFVNVDARTLRSLVIAADYLGISGLRDLTFQAVANRLIGKSVEGIRQVLGITDPGFTAEEEEEIRREQAWFFQ